MPSSPFEDIRRDMTLENRLARDELETLWVHLLRIPSLFRKSMDVIKSDHWFDAGHPELGVLWTAATQMLSASDSATLKLLPLRSKFLAIVKDSDVDIDQRTIQDIVDDPRHDGENRIGLLYHAYHGVAEGDIDYDYGATLVKRFAKEFSVVNPLKKLLNDDQFRDNVPGNLTKVLERISTSAEIVESIDNSQNEGLPFPADWNPKPLIGDPTHLPFLDSFLSGGQIAGEVFGLLGPYGGGKTTIAMHLVVASARAFLAEARRMKTKPRQAYFFGYEDGMDAYRVRLLANAAHILRDRLEAGATMTKRGERLQEYELQYWESLHTNPVALMDVTEMDGEEERIVRAQHELNQTCRVFDMGESGRGKGGVNEIAGILERECQKYGTQPGIIVVDYAGILAQRYIDATCSSSTPQDVYAMIKALPDKFKQLGRRFNCPVWLLHQYTGAANNKSPTSNLHHTDASGTRGFGENCDFCICIGQKDPETRVARVQCTKARRGGTDGKETLMRLDGEFSRVVDASATHRIDSDTRQILPNSIYQQLYGGDHVADQPPRSANDSRPGRRRATERRTFPLIPWQQ